MMMNSEIATSVMLGKKLTIVVLDNRGFGCINRLQMATGGANFNNLLKDTSTRRCPRSTSPRMPKAMGDGAKRCLDRRAGGGPEARSGQ
jgi:3D-(3,5/4)-trihydroxycyclohexane-1,2-dione acylhydrolase (decyclizing)